MSTSRKACCLSPTMSYKLVVVAKATKWVIGDAERWLLVDCWGEKIVVEVVGWGEEDWNVVDDGGRNCC